MILGLSLPDRIKGTPNAGRSKVTQESTRPKEEDHPALEAQLRARALGENRRGGAPGNDALDAQRRTAVLLRSA